MSTSPKRERDEHVSPIYDDQDSLTKNLRVLLVDSDLDYSLVMKNLLTSFSYQVTNYNNGEEAISFLRESKDEIDLVIWDYHMPEVNGLEALNTIGKEMDLPVVIMAHDNEKETVKKSIMCGAYDFLVKPVSKEVITVLWQHVFRKRMSRSGLDKPIDSYSVESDPEELDYGQSNEEGSKNSVEHNNSDQKEDKPSSKKPRMQWTNELHAKFIQAVEKIGNLENAVPKQILKYMTDEMNVKGLTRNNVASHLQKYRQNSLKATQPPPETREDYRWNNALTNVPLTASRLPLLAPSRGFDTRAMYPLNGPIQYSSMPSNLTTNSISNNIFMTTNPLPQPQPQPLPQPQLSSYNDPFYPPNRQQDNVPLSSTEITELDTIYDAILPHLSMDFGSLN